MLTEGFLRRDADDMEQVVEEAKGFDPCHCRSLVEARFSGATMVEAYERLHCQLVARGAALTTG